MNRRLFLLVFLLCSAADLFAAVRVEQVTAGIAGFVRPDRWIPVVLTISNTGDDFKGTIQVLRGKTIFRKSLHLGAGTEKRVEILYYHAAQYEPISYEIIDESGRMYQQATITVSLLNYQDNVVYVISDGEYNHQFLSGQPNPWGGKTFVGYARPVELSSEWLAYSATDAIALGNISPTQLTPAQWRALLQYVASGGVLVCSAATSAAVRQDPYLRNHLPEISPDLNRISRGDFLISRWGARTTDPFPDLEIPAQSIHKRPCDREVIPLNGTSLVTASPYYKGSIVYFGFDYSRMPEMTRTVFAGAWNSTVYPTPSSGPPAFHLPFRRRLEENPRVQKFLYDIPGLHLPDVKWFGLFFFLYICAIGPAQYALLKVLRKNSYLWITFPVIILTFTIASFMYSRYRHSSERTTTQASVIEMFPELNQQTIWQAYGTTLTKSGTFHFQAVPGNSYLRKFVFQSFNFMPEPFVLSEDLPREIVGEQVKTWTFRTFDAISVQPWTEQVLMNVQSDGMRVWGEVTNKGENQITDAFFVYDSRNAKSIGNIPPNSQKRFDLPLTSTSAVPFAENHLRDMLHLYNLSYGAPHFFFGEIRDSQGSLIINGNKETTRCATYIAVYANIKEVGIINPWIVR